MLVDSHCHLDDSQFQADRQAVIERALAAGVSSMLAIGTGEGPPHLDAALRLAEQYSFIYATIGVHPNDTPKILPETFTDLGRLLLHPKVKAIGEIGLDYHWGTPRETQTSAFIRQLELAAAAEMPIVIHTRDAWNDTLEILKSHCVGDSMQCVMHCFTGTVAQADQCLDLGFYLSFGGVTTFPKAIEVREAVRIVPANRLLLETDSPYLAPAPFRGKRNEPAFLTHTAEVVAGLRGVSVEELALQTTQNFNQLFSLENPDVQ